MRPGDQKGERTMAQECLIFLMALIVTFAICDCLQIISFKSRYKIEKSQSRHLAFCRNRVGPYFTLLGKNKCNFRLALFKEKVHCSSLPAGEPVCTWFCNQQENLTRSHRSMLFVVSEKLPQPPFPVALALSLQVAGMDGENEFTDRWLSH